MATQFAEVDGSQRILHIWSFASIALGLGYASLEARDVATVRFLMWFPFVLAAAQVAWRLRQNSSYALKMEKALFYRGEGGSDYVEMSNADEKAGK